MSVHHEFVVVVDEVREPHERRPLVLREITAHSAWVSARARIKHHAELVVVDLVRISSDFLQVLLPRSLKTYLHVNC